MTHPVATASLHDGGGIFTLVWALIVIPFSLAVIFNYRGLAERLALPRRPPPDGPAGRPQIRRCLLCGRASRYRSRHSPVRSGRLLI